MFDGPARSPTPPLSPTATTLWDTVKPVLRGQPRGQVKLAAYDRWPLNTGSFPLEFGSTNPKKKWLFKACDPLIQRPLKIGSTVPLSQDFSWVGPLLAHTAKTTSGTRESWKPIQKFCVNMTAVNCIRWRNDNAFANRFQLREKC